MYFQLVTVIHDTFIERKQRRNIYWSPIQSIQKLPPFRFDQINHKSVRTHAGMLAGQPITPGGLQRKYTIWKQLLPITCSPSLAPHQLLPIYCSPSIVPQSLLFPKANCYPNQFIPIHFFPSVAPRNQLLPITN